MDTVEVSNSMFFDLFCFWFNTMTKMFGKGQQKHNIVTLIKFVCNNSFASECKWKCLLLAMTQYRICKVLCITQTTNKVT